MAIVYTQLNISSSSGFELIDITEMIENFIVGEKLQNGQLVAFSPHTTMALTINELEEGLINDIHLTFNGLIPKNADYEHNAIGENNADAHIKNILVGVSLAIPVAEGKMQLGTWQRIVAVELDGASQRTINVNFIGEQGELH